MLREGPKWPANLGKNEDFKENNWSIFSKKTLNFKSLFFFIF